MAGDIRRVRTARRLNESQCCFAKFFLPVMSLVTCFVIVGSLNVFSVDSGTIDQKLEGRGNLYAPSLGLQIYFIVMLVRDLLITFISCFKGKDDNVPIALITHWVCSFLDSVPLLVFCIWTSVTISRVELTDCADDVTCIGFYKATKTNMIIGYLYLFMHICCCPCFTIAMQKAYDPGAVRHRRDMRRIREYNGNGWVEDQANFGVPAGNVDDEEIPQH